ncbi:MAG: alanine dehydrogenase, partial [Desulforhopalus sp.]
MLIAIPKEILSEEKRVAATAENVKKYIALGFTVAVEAGAGEGVMITDDDYRNAGATIASDVEKMF